LANRERVHLVIEGGAEAPRAAALLKEKHVPVILGPVLQLPTRADDHHAATYKAAAALAEAGVSFALSGGNDATNVRLLPYQAAQSVAWGLSRERALSAITIDAARILGVAAEVGSLEPGKRADLFISNGDPLEARTQITHVFINGRNVGVDNIHKRLYGKARGQTLNRSVVGQGFSPAFSDEVDTEFAHAQVGSYGRHWSRQRGWRHPMRWWCPATRLWARASSLCRARRSRRAPS
jgi:hypothetical protein